MNSQEKKFFHLTAVPKIVYTIYFGREGLFLDVIFSQQIDNQQQTRHIHIPYFLLCIFQQLFPTLEHCVINVRSGQTRVC